MSLYSSLFNTKQIAVKIKCQIQDDRLQVRRFGIRQNERLSTLAGAGKSLRVLKNSIYCLRQ